MVTFNLKMNQEEEANNNGIGAMTARALWPYCICQEQVKVDTRKKMGEE